MYCESPGATRFLRHDSYAIRLEHCLPPKINAAHNDGQSCTRLGVGRFLLALPTSGTLE